MQNKNYKNKEMRKMKTNRKRMLQKIINAQIYSLYLSI